MQRGDLKLTFDADKLEQVEKLLKAVKLNNETVNYSIRK